MLTAVAQAAPPHGPATRTTKLAVKGATVHPAAATPVRHDGAHARMLFGKELHPAREVVGRREEPLTPEEETAKQIEKLLRGPLRYGVTGLFVADARTGEPLFAVNADDPLNPASNVKMISTAAALELLGPSFRYTTRLLGPEPDAHGAIHGDVYLLGSWDPTLHATDLDEIAMQVSAKGVKELDGDVVIGADPTRDGIYKAVVPITVKAGIAGEQPSASAPPGYDLVAIGITAKTAATPLRYQRLTYTSSTFKDGAGHTRVALTVGGTIGKGQEITTPVMIKERTFDAAHMLRAALRAHNIVVNGDVRVGELSDFVGDTANHGALPGELGRHDSKPLVDIVREINKYSINWLADRVIMTAAALSRRTTPSMDVALDAMYAWLARHPKLAKPDVVVDTGSGLSYRTRITPHELVAIVRDAAGFTDNTPPDLAHAWLDSLSIAGTDGTLVHRFRTADLRGHIHAKTGSLSTVIALSGVLDIDPMRPLVFSIVTNGDRPLSKGYVRKAHEQVLGLISKYIAQTTKTVIPEVKPETPSTTPAQGSEEPEESEPELDAETAGHAMPGETPPAAPAIDGAMPPPTTPAPMTTPAPPPTPPTR
ncbi:MAG: D-alanyl-D-alanine carboxypeptidase/D-alanyl-D-alanine-endopeptidase [Deltaproteobacteria bacterium]|nr:D-alanyl-D-alanine carboxypeptidase/D-alanyl-D-alanine-endopeptidase [Deltaproteobacteria bacterium]